MITSTPTLDSLFTAGIPEDLEEDTKAILEKLATGRPLDPAIYARITQRADRIREEVFRRHGVLDIGVPAIRELRDAE